jgi:hypothetical protein
MLKTDWVAVFIATFGVAVIVWHGWNSRKADPVMKKISLWAAWAYQLAMDDDDDSACWRKRWCLKSLTL